ncbi:MAG TPA: tellurite resistance TerB C-terminal domain-containing protein [Thermosynechococcaceae cyanobacterium]
MVNNRFLLGSIAFGVSFGITLLTSRDLSRSLFTGAVALPGVYLATAVVDRRVRQSKENRLETLRGHILSLQQRRFEAYQEFTQMLEEKEQVAAALNSMQLQTRQLQLAGSATQNLSWNLAGAEGGTAMIEVQPYNLPTEIQDPHDRVPQFSQVLADAAAAKRKIEVSLDSLQIELGTLKEQVTEYRQKRDRLAQELAQLETKSATARAEVQELEQNRAELERFISYAETKKQELDSGRHPLQAALKQLQTEINALHEESRLLETQVVDRRHQKQELEQQLGKLGETPLPVVTVQVERPRSNGSSATKSTPSPQLTKQVDRPRPSSTPSLDLPSFPKLEQAPASSPSEFSDEWTELIMQLPEHEFQALQAIVEQSNPGPTLRKIAEANLTMPELLLDSINERALDTIGDLILEPGSGAGTATIVPEHLKSVKTLLQTYEYLMR